MEDLLASLPAGLQSLSLMLPGAACTPPAGAPPAEEVLRAGGQLLPVAHLSSLRKLALYSPPLHLLVGASQLPSLTVLRLFHLSGSRLRGQQEQLQEMGLPRLPCHFPCLDTLSLV